MVTVNDPNAPTVNVALFALVNDGASNTVNVKPWVASGDVEFAAVIVNGNTPPVAAAGVPDKVAEPSALSTKVTPAGNAPDSDNDVNAGKS